MPSKICLQRINDRIRNELAEMLVKEVQDPRVSGVSITDVRVDRELAYADIYVSAVEGQERSKEILEGMRSASGFLRHELAARVDLRAFPRLRFHWDPTPEKADHIEKVLAEIRENEPQSSSEPVDEENQDVQTEDEENDEE